ncbi:MAG: PilZ domain-containing protein [Rheinheimera sp.]|nr:PilZ domain-containing protein [Rheinheimera sp.]
MDNRKFSRILFSSKARIIQAGQNYDTELLDLSLKGALVRRSCGLATKYRR